jgi:dolichol-phosphate mannosyltransferase
VPTYKEAQNLRPLVERIFRATLGASLKAEVIVVDDDSQDGTDAMCGTLAKEYPVRLITRRGIRGLSTAVIAGFRAANGQFLICMDADLSHPPEAIPEFYSRLVAGAHFVLGSRYVEGGVIEKRWGLHRRINSSFAAILARPLVAVGDPMTGFFGLARSTFDHVRALSPLGYKIGLELLVKARPQKIAEIPIHFSDRQFGQSKLSLRVQLEYLRHLRRLYIHAFPFVTELIQFLTVGSLGLLIDLSVYSAALAFTDLNHILARTLSFLCAATHNWLLNRRYTFDSQSNRPLRQWALYLAAAGVGALLNIGTYAILTTNAIWFAEHRVPALLVGVAVGAAFNFAAARVYIFSRLIV